MTATHEDRILLRLRREYSKDEAFALLSKKVKEVEFKNGQLLSEIAELKYKMKQKTPKEVVKEVIKYVSFEDGSKNKKQWLKDDLIAEYERVAKFKQSKLNYTEKSLIEYRNKYLSLLKKSTSS